MVCNLLTVALSPPPLAAAQILESSLAFVPEAPSSCLTLPGILQKSSVIAPFQKGLLDTTGHLLGVGMDVRLPRSLFSEHYTSPETHPN